MNTKAGNMNASKGISVFFSKLVPGNPMEMNSISSEMEFHISREARDKFNIDAALYSMSGNRIFADFQSVQRLAAQVNNGKGRAGEINGMGLIDEIFHVVVSLYRQQKNSPVFEKALERLEGEMGTTMVDNALRLFADHFPSTAVYKGESTLDAYMEGETAGIPNREVLLEEMMMLWLSNVNPAFSPYRIELFDDSVLQENSAYFAIIESLEGFFSTQVPFGPDNLNLLAMLRMPAIVSPNSIPGQLNYIREHWGMLLGDYLTRILTGLDRLKEEEKFTGMGPGKTHVIDFSGFHHGDAEYERFTADHDWMPRMILMAKSTYVWLWQLSEKYKTSITKLDEIPDEELDELARRGFTGLWLIGVWERSQASKRIKQLCGNPEALASAYSIYDYRIASELGGEPALHKLKYRAWNRGIRIASDMVPNHMGLDSPWLVEHPDWFLSLNYSPFFSYTFNGPDLSADPRVSIFLEDHYYDRTDAAVVFKWVSNQTGEVRYIYHGNDGTSMPWNDTAQLNYMNPEAREAVMRTIFSVSEMFPVIRFDAAMTLTKRHYQRLWFPEPGSGGDIPSRSEQGLTKNDFNRHMPEEFWRKVVDRFSESNSDTLLLAEAFWMMEPYFVRTLGMHRVYNSAFMNFLKNEQNAEFRTSIKNVLLFNPEILKRYVNFMNNPDEETAVKQFGKDDKYMGVCTLMVTMPGLPMFGHGQIEGFHEKYGMEYFRPYWDESPDHDLIQRHEHEVFPLMRKRFLFAEVEHFLLYDFYTPDGWVNENVIVYSNRRGSERSLVVFHNKFAETSGWIKNSAPFVLKTGDSDPGTPVRRSLGEGLALTHKEGFYILFRDHDSGLEYIRENKELVEKGLYIELQAFKKNVFLGFREVEDRDGAYFGLHKMLGGKGVPSIDDLVRRHFRNSLAAPFRNLLNLNAFNSLDSLLLKKGKKLFKEAKVDASSDHRESSQLQEKIAALLNACAGISGGDTDISDLAMQARLRFERFSVLPCVSDSLDREMESTDSPHTTREYHTQRFVRLAQTDFDSHPYLKPFLYAWECVWAMDVFLNPDKTNAPADTTWNFMTDWALIEIIDDFFVSCGVSKEQSSRLIDVLRLLLRYSAWWKQFSQTPGWFETFFSDPLLLEIIRANYHNGIQWFHRESAEEFIHILFFVIIFCDPVDRVSVRAGNEGESACDMTYYFPLHRSLHLALHYSGYRLDRLVEIFSRLLL